MAGSSFISNFKLKRKIKHSLIFLLLFFVADFAIGLLMKRIIPEVKFGTYGKINKSLNAKEQILIFGSSRAADHYDPTIISRETSMSCYNTGMGGYGLFYNYAIFNELVKNHKPDVVIIDLSPNVIVDPQSYDKLNVFMPYYFYYPTFKEIIQLDPSFSTVKTFLKTDVYNSTLYDIVRGAISGKKTGNGYKGLKDQIDTSIYQPMYLSPDETFNKLKKDYLIKFIDIAVQHDIRLICIISPTYEKFDTDNTIIDEIKKITKARGIEFYDYSDFDKLYKKPEYFKNQLHMNERGVEIFDTEISQNIIHH